MSRRGTGGVSQGDKARAANIFDVARLAGVSHQTVSRVLRGLGGMRPETRTRVQEVLAELRYRPSVVARELASSRPSRIGVVGYETFESSTSKVLKGVNDVATEAGYVLDIVTVDPLGAVDEIVRRLDAINGSDVAGLLATSPTAYNRSIVVRPCRSVHTPPHWKCSAGATGISSRCGSMPAARQAAVIVGKRRANASTARASRYT